MLLLSLDLSRSRGHKSAEKWQSGRMHTPAKGAGPNKGLEGSNPSFSARKVPNLAHFELISVLFLLLALGRFPLIFPQYPKNIQKQFIRPEIE